MKGEGEGSVRERERRSTIEMKLHIPFASRETILTTWLTGRNPVSMPLWSQVPRAEVVPLRTGGEHAGQINGASLYFSNSVPYMLFFIPSVDTSLTSEFNSRAMCLC